MRSRRRKPFTVWFVFHRPWFHCCFIVLICPRNNSSSALLRKHDQQVQCVQSSRDKRHRKRSFVQTYLERGQKESHGSAVKNHFGNTRTQLNGQLVLKFQVFMCYNGLLYSFSRRGKKSKRWEEAQSNGILTAKYIYLFGKQCELHWEMLVLCHVN